MTTSHDLGREAFAREAWQEAYTLLSAIDPAEPDDLQRLAVASHLVGRDGDSDHAWERAHHALAARGDVEAAARCAFWLGLSLLMRGEAARAGGWLARAERLLEAVDRDCAAKGLLLLPQFLEAVETGHTALAAELADRTVAIAQQCGDADVLAFGVLARGQATLAAGDIGAGMKLLDEVMVSVTTGEVSPIPSGIIYCAVIEACMDVFDLRRAAEWTGAVESWCAAHPDLVPYRGQCLVHRSQILQAHGEWGDAVAEADQARARLADPAHPALGLALYQRGELHRLRGEFAEAERAYRAAGEQGREPAPGVALLRLAEGKVDAAAAAIRRMVEESRGTLSRPTMLAAAVEVLLAAGDVESAGAAGDELAALARDVDRPLLRAISAYATGCVLLARDDAPAAVAVLRDACTTSRALEMPYDTARARVRLALACRALGDDDAADRELDAARATFERLGARPDLVAIDRLTGQAGDGPPSVLTDRELEVLRLVASGKPNREIASHLVISEKTVARHLQNIYMKLGVSSRTAAAAYAYEHNLA